jgi:hypothetical protein
MTSNGSTNGNLSVSVSGTLTGGADPSGSEVAAAVSGNGASSVGHTHSVSVGGSLGGVASGSLGVTVGGNANSSAFGVVQPTIILNHIIKT